MPTFNGDTLIITLDPVVDGVLDVDVGIDLYTEWKSWAKLGNLRYPAAFRTTGGDELTVIIDAGSYFFLRNDFGWRIKSYENDATYYLVGNLAVQNTALPAFIPTIGTYTAAILGLQPVTQGVTAAMGDQLAFNTYQGAVCVDTVGGYAGTGSIGSDEIGTRKAPSSNMTDGLTIAKREGLTRFNLVSNITINSALDFSAGYQFVGDRPQLILTLDAAPNMSNCSMSNITMTGDVDGVNTIRDASVGALTDVSGFIEKVSFYDDIILAGSVNIFEAYSQKAGSGYVVFDTGAHGFQVSDWHRSMGITNMTAGLHTIEMYGGQLHLDSTCVGGTIHLRGDYSTAPDDQSNGTILIDETSSKRAHEMHGQVTREVWVDPSLLVNGNGYQQSPYNNLTDAIDYAEANGITSLVVLDDFTLDRDLKNFTVRGIGVPSIDLAGYDLKGCRFFQTKLTGAYTNTITAQECVLLAGMYLNGFFENCALAGDLICIDAGTVYMTSSASSIAGLGRPTISMNGAGSSKLSVRNHGGGLTVKDCNNPLDEVTVEMGRVGSLTFDSSCTDGQMVARTNGKFVDATAGAAVEAEAYTELGKDYSREAAANTQPI